MNTPNQSFKPAMFYFQNDDGKFECHLCHKTYEQSSNCIKHIRKKHVIDPSQFSIFTYNGDYITKETERILIWKAVHGISMYALCDPLFSELFKETVLFSDKTNQKIMNQMSSQIIEMNYQKTANQEISLILDG